MSTPYYTSNNNFSKISIIIKLNKYKEEHDMLNDFYERLSKKENKMIEIRRYLHEHPELSFEEKRDSTVYC